MNIESIAVVLMKPDRNKQRLWGAVYTPENVAAELTRVAIGRHGSLPKSVLEPSAGDGAFLRAIDFEGVSTDQVFGLDVDPEAILHLRGEFPSATFECRDFIDFAINYEGTKFDLIVGNPPYIKRHNYDALFGSSVAQLGRACDYPLSELKNAWAAFVVASNLLLSDTGVLAFVVPYELLNVKYGQFLQAFLADAFGSVEIFIPRDKAFRDLDQDAVALVATRAAPKTSPGLKLSAVNALSDLHPIKTCEVKFAQALVSSVDLNSIFFDEDTSSLLHRLRASLPKLGDFAASSAGVVSAANSFFILTSTQIDERGLQNWARPILKKGSYLPPGPILTEQHLKDILQREPGYLVDFVQPNGPELSTQAIQYLEEGASLGLDSRYKSRHRSPWYNIPIVNASDGIFFKRAHSFPRLLVNEAQALVTDTAYQVTMNEGFFIRDLCFSFYNSLTLLFCEMDGRFYGGGVLELTPTEFRGLPVHFSVPGMRDFEEFLANFPQSKTPEAANFGFADLRLAQQLGLSNREISNIQVALQTVRGHRLRHGS